MNCLFCADPKMVRQQPDQDFNEILCGLKESRAKFESLIITGGEPTIYKRLFSVLEYAKSICRYSWISLVTNGVLLSYDKFIDRLIESGVDSFQISYFALDEKKQDAIARTKGTFERINKGIKNAVSRNKEVRINLVINKMNYSDLPRIVEHLIKLKVNSITLVFMNPCGTSVINGKSVLALPYGVIMPFIQTSFEKAQELNFDKMYIENFPICIGKDYIEYISDLHKPKENYEYYNSSKVKPPKCKGCVYYDMCDGIWRTHLEQFGDDELIPLNSKLNSKIDIYD